MACMGLSLSRRHYAISVVLCHSILCSTCAASILCPDRIFELPSRAAAVKDGSMTVIAMSRKIDRMTVLDDRAGEQKMTEAASLMRLGAGVGCSGWRGPTHSGARGRCFPGSGAGRAIVSTLRFYAMPLASSGSVTRTSARHWRQISLQSFMTSDAPVEACSSAGCTAAIVWAS